MCEEHFCWAWKNNCAFDWASFWSGFPGWLQAIGALVGLGVTIYLYKDQISQNRVARNEARIEKRRAQALVANHFSEVANSLIVESMAFQQGAEILVINYEYLKNVAVRIEDVIIWTRIFVIDTFSNEDLASFIRIRGTLHSISTWILRSDYGVIVGSPNYIQNLYNSIHDELQILANSR